MPFEPFAPGCKTMSPPEPSTYEHDTVAVLPIVHKSAAAEVYVHPVGQSLGSSAPASVYAVAQSVVPSSAVPAPPSGPVQVGVVVTIASHVAASFAAHCSVTAGAYVHAEPPPAANCTLSHSDALVRSITPAQASWSVPLPVSAVSVHVAAASAVYWQAAVCAAVLISTASQAVWLAAASPLRSTAAHSSVAEA